MEPDRKFIKKLKRSKVRTFAGTYRRLHENQNNSDFQCEVGSDQHQQ